MKKLIFVYLLFAGLLVKAQQSNDILAPVIKTTVHILEAKNSNTSKGTYQHLDNSLDVQVADNVTAAQNIKVNYHFQGATQGNSSTLNGKEFNKGTTLVFVAAMDEAGNVSTAQFNILVLGGKITFLDCPDNQNNSFEANKKGTFEFQTNKLNPTLNPAKVKDCSYTLYGATSGYGQDLKGQSFKVGQTKVVWIVTDLNDKQGACLYDINVIENR